MSLAQQPGLLSVVGTPIGNLGDMSPRAAQALEHADAVLCEDTRVTAKLMSYLGVHTPLERCDANVIGRRAPELVERLLDGAHLAFVSDAGMPCISDPGQLLVDAALDAGVAVEVVPGPSAVVAALARAGLSANHFFFEGFLPRKAGERSRRLNVLAQIPGALVLYESPHRVADTLGALAEQLPGRRVALVRELTKIHEECLRGGAAELLAELEARAAAGRQLKGECVIVVEEPLGAGVGAGACVEGHLGALSAGAPGAVLEPPSHEELISCAAELLEHLSPAQAAKELRRSFGLTRTQAYDLVLEAKNQA